MSRGVNAIVIIKNGGDVIFLFFIRDVEQFLLSISFLLLSFIILLLLFIH